MLKTVQTYPIGFYVLGYKNRIMIIQNLQGFTKL